MKIAVGEIWVFLETYDIENIVPVCYFPSIDVFCEAFPVVPEVISVFAAPSRHLMRMAGDNEGILSFCRTEYVLIIPVGRDEILQIDQRYMGQRSDEI